jgi:hypothetical protein
MEKQEPIGRYRKLGKIPYAIFLIFMVLGVALAVFYIFGFSIFGETLLNISFRFFCCPPGRGSTKGSSGMTGPAASCLSPFPSISI